MIRTVAMINTTIMAQPNTNREMRPFKTITNIGDSMKYEKIKTVDNLHALRLLLTSFFIVRGFGLGAFEFLV